MQIRSLGYRTDLIFPKFEGEIIDRGQYLVIRTPANPTYYWGNFLLFGDPPTMGDFDAWRRLFAEEIGAPPAVEHIALGWDVINGEQGDIQPFLDAGFEPNESIVLTAQSVQPPPKINTEVIIRPITKDWEWEAALQKHVACREDRYSLEGYTIYIKPKMERYRAMTRAGLGAWFGAFLGNRLVADLGIFTDGDVARFQAVGTHPAFRRRGICGTLVHQAALHAFAHFGVKTLVMLADENYHAAKIYESIGFLPTERTIGVTWWK